MQTLKIFFLVLCLISPLPKLFAQSREVQELNSDWKFCKSISSSIPDDKLANWESVSVPHTWNNMDGQDGGGNYYRGIAWYKKTFSTTKETREKRVFVKFHAVNRYAEIYLNNQLIGNHTGGYAAFVFEITNQIKDDQSNVLAVKVSNADTIISPPLEADFTFYGGITRKVELIYTNPVHITLLDYGSPGVYIDQRNVSEQKAELSLRAIIKNDLPSQMKVEVKYLILDQSGKIINEIAASSSIKENQYKELTSKTSIASPHLWNGLTDPYLYKVKIQVHASGKLMDEVIQPLGIRYIHIDKDQGFYLNGKPYSLHGVAHHEEMKDKGSAMNDEDRKRDLDILKDLGCNYIRLSHYQHGNYSYDYCDDNGILVWTEIPLINKIAASSSFKENTNQQLIELIRQNYNHPSVFVWGISNEITYKSGPDPYSLIQQLHSLAKKEDPSRLTANAAMHPDTLLNFISDIYSCNVYNGWYINTYHDFGPWADRQRKKYPKKAFGVSEYGAGGNVFQHEPLNPKEPINNGPWHPEEYQSLFHEAHWQQMITRPYLWSTSIWIAFDFGSDGRNEGSQPGINDKGLITRDRSIKKDAYYFYQANWKTDPLVHITSKRFAVRKDSVLIAKVYSNCDSVKLKINQDWLDTKVSKSHIYEWNAVRLVKGKNSVVAMGYKNGNTYTDTCFWNLQVSVENSFLKKVKVLVEKWNNESKLRVNPDSVSNNIDLANIPETMTICIKNEEGEKVGYYKDVKPGTFSISTLEMNKGSYKMEMKGKSSSYFYSLIIE